MTTPTLSNSHLIASDISLKISAGAVMLPARKVWDKGSEPCQDRENSTPYSLLPTLIHFHFLLHVFREEAGAGFGFGVATFFVGLDVGFFIDGAAIAAVAGGGGNRRCGSDEQKG